MCSWVHVNMPVWCVYECKACSQTQLHAYPAWRSAGNLGTWMDSHLANEQLHVQQYSQFQIGLSKNCDENSRMRALRAGIFE